MSASKWKKYPEYRDFDNQFISKIPNRWEYGKLKFLSSISARIGWKGLKASDYVDSSDFAFLSIPNLKTKNIDFDNVNYIEEHLYLDSPNLMLKKDDVLLAKVGATLGIVNIVESLPINSTVNGSIAVLRPIDLIPKFFKYYIESNLFQTYLQVYKTGMGVPSVTQEALGDFPVFIPPKETQKHIVEFLETNLQRIDSLISSYTLKWKILEEKRSVLITEAVTKGLNPNASMKNTDIDWFGKIPSHWNVSKIGYIAKIISKGTTPSTLDKQLVDEGIRFLKAENIHYDGSVSITPEFYIDEETDNLLKRSRLISNDILMVIAGATTGKCAILTSDLVPANTNQAVCFIRLHDKRISIFIQTWLSCELIQERIKQDSVQSAQPNLAMEDLRNFVCPMPPIDEIEQITNRIINITNNISNSKSAIKKQIDFLVEYRKSLILAAVTGKIDVRSL